MKKLLIYTLILIINTGIINAQNLSSFFYYTEFTTPLNEPYIETYISIAGNSASFEINNNGEKQASIEVTMLFKQDTLIKEFRKYNLKSPEFADSLEVFPSFIDMQRIPLKNGEYNFELYLKDNFADTAITFRHYEKIEINYADTTMSFSGIQLVEKSDKSEIKTKFTKSGVTVIPYVSNFYPETVENLCFYFESYNLDRKIGMDEGFLFRYHIEPFHSEKALGKFSFFQKQQAAPVNVFLKEIPVVKLPSGIFETLIELRDKQNELLGSKKVFFQRSNPSLELNLDDIIALDINGTFAEKITNRDSLAEYIKYVRPISDNVEKTYADNQLKAADLKLMQQYFYNFWLKRNMLSPEQDWKQYLAQVELVNRSYSHQIKKGYEITTELGEEYYRITLDICPKL